jgi:hypothetical protein
VQDTYVERPTALVKEPHGDVTGLRLAPQQIRVHRICSMRSIGAGFADDFTTARLPPGSKVWL